MVEKVLVGIATSQGAEKEEGTERRWKKSDRKGAAMERSGEGKERLMKDVWGYWKKGHGKERRQN